jgi:MFS family permease
MDQSAYRDGSMMTHSAHSSRPRAALTLLAVCLAAVSMPLAFTGPAVALGAIAKSLGGDPVALNWTTNAFMLTFGGGLMAAGAMADSYGRRRLFLIGTGGFALCSVALALAPGLVAFDLLRAAQGAAAAAALSSGMAALAQEVEEADRPRAFSLVGASFGAGLAFGPMISGYVVVTLGWRGIFALGMLFALAAFAIGAGRMRESRDPQARGLDLAGAASFTAALALFTWSLLQAPESGWRDPRAFGAMAAAVGLGAAFWMIERRVARPMLDLSLFRYPRFVGVQLLAAAPAYGFVVLLVLLPIRFVGVEGMDALAAGRLMIALSGPLLVLPVAAGALTRWASPSTLCGGGLLLTAVGLAWMSRLPLHAASAPLVAAMATVGVGISLPWGLMDGLAVSVAPKERAGMAAGIFSTTRVAGEGVALAVVVAVLSAFIAARLGEGQAASAAAQRLVTGDLAAAARLVPSMSPTGLRHAYDEAFQRLLLLLSGVTLSTAVVVFLFLGRRGAARLEAAAAASETA